MRILSLTAGAASMYCGSCLRDNALASELQRLGHDVWLTPLYTPLKTDEQSVAGGHVLFGGISVYLQQHSSFFRHTPWLLDKLWDSRWALKAASKRAIAVDARYLGEMTVSMLEGEQGVLAKEFHKLKDWLRQAPRPDVINLPYTLVISLARSIKEVLGAPLCCTLQGEDFFLDGLPEPYRSRSLELIKSHTADVDAFISVGERYAGRMAEYLAIPREKIHVVPLGVRVDDFKIAGVHEGPFNVGYFARIAPEKGLHLLAESYRRFRDKYSGSARLSVAGYLAPEHAAYLAGIEKQMGEWGLADEFHYFGELDRAHKINFLSSLDVLSVVADFDDPKGFYVLEALASGVPVIAPDRGTPPEMIERTGGGFVVPPGDPDAVAATLADLASDRNRARDYGKIGRMGVERFYTLRQMAANTLAVYQSLLKSAPETVNA